jgi:SnoaL-like domain
VIAGGNPSERLAIEELIDNYARQADLGDIHAQSLVFVEDARMLLFLEGDDEPTEVFHGRAQISPVFAALRRLEQRTNLNGQRSVRLLGATGRRARAPRSRTMLASRRAGGVLLIYVRFVDDLVKHDGEWRFRKRQLHILFREHRALES